jgi:hypothetical protein
MLEHFPVTNSPWRPPLADHLFDRPAFFEIMALHPYVKAIVPQLTGVKQTPLERILDTLQSQAESYPARRSQLTDVRFYLRDLLVTCRLRWGQVTQGITNYFSLLDQLQEWQHKAGKGVCIVTFNYDLLLEDALPTVGVDTSSLDGYVAHPKWKVIKPHGSVNWARPTATYVEPPTVERLTALAADGISVTDEIVLGTAGTRYGDTNRMLYPAIAIPLESYKDFECPPEHLSTLEECIRQTSQILIIGWRATERSFLEILARNMPSQMRFFIHIACGDSESASQTWNNLQKAGVGKQAVMRPYGGFSQLMRSEDLRTMLLATG